jgi:hypothetical protein
MVIADSDPHSPEISAAKPGVNSVFFISDDVVSLSRTLVSIVRSDGLLATMSKEARLTVEGRFSLECMATVFERAVISACMS